MKNLEKYLRYYFLEKYLFGEVSKNFRNNKQLTAEEFFAVVIWKRNASKTKIKDSLINIKAKKNIEKLTKEINDKKDREGKLKLLTDIRQIGVSIASAILTVCYPEDFTVADYRSCNSLKKILDEQKHSDLKNKFPSLVKYLETKKIQGSGNINEVNDLKSEVYFELLDACEELAKRFGNISLRNFDRILWGMDFYDGKNGLNELKEKYNKKEIETKKPLKIIHTKG